MAQNELREYKGCIAATKLTSYTGTIIPDGTVMIMKTTGVNVSVNGSVMFPVSYDDESVYNSSYTYKFDKDYIIALADKVVV